MRWQYQCLFFGIFSATLLGVGCETTVQAPAPNPADTGTDTPDGPTDPTGTISGLTFPDDANPAIAALRSVENELLVQPFPGAEDHALTDLYASVGALVLNQIPEIGVTALQVPAGLMQGTADRLANSGLVEAVHKNYIFPPESTPNDPLYPQQPHLNQIGAPAAWDFTTGSDGLLIAIVDTGVDREHPDLKDKIIDGWNIYGGNGDFTDVVGHGTMVAGVAAAASNNAAGVAGVAWDNPILAVRVADPTGNSTARHIAAGILWAVSHGAKVINVSFAPLWSNTVVKAAAEKAFNRGAVVVISAGNAGGLTSAPGYGQALFVGALDANNAIASFSDRGPFVDLAAPGTGIRSTKRGSDYDTTNGTSFAAPIVSGVAALVLSINPNLRPTSVQFILLESVLDLGSPGKDDTFGAGAVDAALAVELADRMTAEPDTTPPALRVKQPALNAKLSGKASATVTVSDNEGVADVVMSLDDIPVATDATSPFQFMIDTAQYSAGIHELSFQAMDVSGNRSLVRVVPVTFEAGTATSPNGGNIRFHSPLSGSKVSGNVIIQATVSDPDGLATVEWFVDGASVFVTPVTGTSSGVSYLWRSSNASRGEHTITVSILDSTGSQSTVTLNLVK